MYENEIAKAWAQETPGLTTDPRHLPTEEARWAALAKQPLLMAANIFQYGPLSVDGYLDARRRSYDKSWPVEPATIAKLLFRCGVDAASAGYAAIEHTRYMPSNDMAFASSLLIHVEVLKLLNIPLNSDLLLDAIADVQWGTANTDEYPPLLWVMNLYLQNEDASVFLHKWLPDLKACPEAYGEGSLGVALVQAFPTCDPAPLIQWCRKHDEQQALGFLVWQNRLSFKAWLAEVADQTDVEDRRERHGDDYAILLIEQTATFHQIINKLPVEQLQLGCAELFADNPEALKNLLARTQDAPASTESISWVACLTRVGALPADHPLMHDWIERAYSAQDEIISGGSKSKNSVSSEIYRDLRTAFSTNGERVRDVVARHMALNMSVSHFYSADIEWLSRASISSALCALHGESGRGVHAATAALFSCLCNEDKASVAMHIMRSVMKRESNAKEILRLLKQQDMESYAGVDIVPGKEVLSLLSAMTKLDVAPLMETCSVLGMSENDPMFYTAVEGFVQAAFAGNAVGPTLPELESPETRSY